MKEKDNEIIVKYKKEGYNFEIIVYLRKALEYKEGKIKDIREVLVSDDTFKDARKGERASTESLNKVFGTTDNLKIAEEIIKNSEIPLPTEYKRELIEERKKQIIEYIRRISYDAKNNMPLTYERAKELFEMIRYTVDLNKPIEKQAEEVIKEIRKKYPLKIEYKNIRLIVYPQKFKIIGIIKNKYKVIRENWRENYEAILEIPIGLLSEFYSDIGKLCGDDCIIEEIKK
ncbi:MAG: ribosome assembly factor SBDS [Nanopusillaceae archaeon]|jgi:ribosome maturation protein SDO1